jgi:hypothetical protein
MNIAVNESLKTNIEYFHLLVLRNTANVSVNSLLLSKQIVTLQTFRELSVNTVINFQTNKN